VEKVGRIDLHAGEGAGLDARSPGSCGWRRPMLR